MFIKIMGNDNSIVAVEEHQNPVYVCYQQFNKIVVRCEKQNSQGLLSADSSQIYQISGKTTMPGVYLKCSEITEAEYEELYPALEIEEPTEETEETTPEVPTADGVMTVSEMRAKIIALTEQVEFLGDCLVEMSEVVYD